MDSASVFFPGEPITLGYRDNDLTLHFSAIDFDNAGRNSFFYRINGGEWLSIRDNRVHLSNMAPGTYKIEISANTTTIRQVTIVIRPPFWRTWWFVTIVILVSLATAYALIRGKIRRQLLLIRLSRDLATSQLKALHAQMNPHFVFNSLNSIHQMILSNDNPGASHYLGKFAHLIRISLEQSSRSFISLRHTIDYLQCYVDMEKIRHLHFTFSLEADPSLNPDETLLPPMLIQPIIENAIWHGCSPDRSIHITLRFLSQDKATVCLVDDDGIGINASLRNKSGATAQHRSLGLQNIRDRVQLLNERYGLQSSLTIRDKSPHATGTLVTLLLSTIKEEI
jgi:sensor histidine kinase YesM